jgi:hypothetical protein
MQAPGGTRGLGPAQRSFGACAAERSRAAVRDRTHDHATDPACLARDRWSKQIPNPETPGESAHSTSRRVAGERKSIRFSVWPRHCLRHFRRWRGRDHPPRQRSGSADEVTYGTCPTHDIRPRQRTFVGLQLTRPKPPMTARIGGVYCAVRFFGLTQRALDRLVHHDLSGHHVRSERAAGAAGKISSAIPGIGDRCSSRGRELKCAPSPPGTTSFI